MKRNTGETMADMVAVILGFSDMLLEEDYGSLYPKQEAVLKQVQEAARRLQQILLENPPRFVQD